MEARHAEMMLLALSTMEDLEATFDFLDGLQNRSDDIGSLALAGPLSACERRGLRGQAPEQRLLALLAKCPDLGAAARNAVAIGMAEGGDKKKAFQYLNEALLIPGGINALSLQLLACYGEDFHQPVVDICFPVAVKAGTRLVGASRPHEKEARLLTHVLSNAHAGDAAAACQAIEEFGRDSLSRPYGGGGGYARSAGQWLKVAGGDKAEVLAMAARIAGRRGRFLEVGTYCGYSSMRLALAGGEGVKVVSLEADPGCAVIARNIVAFAGLTHQIDVRIGHSEDMLPHLMSGIAGGEVPTFDLVFFDQRGSRYTADLRILERFHALPPGAVVVADNVLKPGAPAFLWHVLFSGLYDTQLVAVEEFSMPGVEDWMSVSVCKPFIAEAQLSAPPLPEALRQLEWEADRIRTRAERTGVGFEVWAEFSARMRRSLLAHGICPD